MNPVAPNTLTMTDLNMIQLVAVDLNVEKKERSFIYPFVDHQVSQNPDGTKVVSYGLSSFGYDARLGTSFMRLRKGIHYGLVFDVKDPHNSERFFEKFEVTAGYIDLPPHSFHLAQTLEYFDIPRNMYADCKCKSTWVRSASIIPVTPLEPGWRGYCTLEIHNLLPSHLRLYIGEGICQFVFHVATHPPKTAYDQRPNPKYQDQTGVVGPRV